MKVDRIEYDKSMNPSTKDVVGWIASSVECDVHGFVDPVNMLVISLLIQKDSLIH